MIEFADVEAPRGGSPASPTARRSLTSRTLDERTGAHVHVKAECFQRGGAFKFRGAYNKISSLDEDALARGVLAYSSGNHAQAVALAARLLGSHATIVMPEDAPAAKLDATRGYGAEIVTYDRWTENREEIGAALAAERGLELVPPYDDPLVMAGQGTAALELLDGRPGARPPARPGQRRRADRRLRDRGEGAAPGLPRRRRRAGAGRRHAAVARGRERIRIDVPRTIADGLQATEPGELTFEVNSSRVDEIVTVTDEEIVAAMVFLFDRLKLVAEPSGAVGVAALLSGKLDAARPHRRRDPLRRQRRRRALRRACHSAASGR